MSLTIEAIYEDGVLKPSQPIALAEGTRVSLVIEPTNESQSGQSPAAILSAIAALPLEATEQSVSNREHDQLLYGAGEQP